MAANIFMNMPQGSKMPAIGLGTGRLGEESVLESALTTALDLGYRHIDTAFSYQNEVFIGRVLKKFFSSGKIKREELFITTKLSMPGVHEDRVEMFMKKSLENLQLDYVDLYLIHFPIGVKYFEGMPLGPGSNPTHEIDVFDHIKIWKKMEEQVDAGRTKNIGLSNFNQRQIERILKSARIKPSCLQVEVHVDFQQRDLVDFCRKNGIVVVAYTPLGSPGPRKKPRKVPVILHNETIKKIADKYKKTNAQIMLRYLLQKNIAAIPLSSNPVRLKENIDVFDFKIDSKDMVTLDGLEAGELARLGRFNAIKGIEDHPEYPIPKE